MKPLILITNDDGVYSPGIKATIEAVMDLGDIVMAAPIRQQTGMGRSFPRTEDLGIIETVEIATKRGKVTAYGVHGSPAYAVVHGILELAPRKPDLCISGINYGENLGMVLTCSGTVGAVLEANSHGIPGIAVSAELDYSKQRTMDYPDYSWEISQAVTKYWTEKVVEKGMPKGVDMLNINVPVDVWSVEDYRITELEQQNYYVFQRPGEREFGEPVQIEAKVDVDEETLKVGSDIHTIYIERKISVTPLQWNMSAAIPEHW